MASHDQDARIVGSGQEMRQIKRYLMRVAGVGSTVLITGETGTGKELVAETIHTASTRSTQPMVCVNCAAIPDSLVESELFGYCKGAFTGALLPQKGKFALATHGTLFLDEIGEMSPHAQAKILRSIESNTIFPLGARRAVQLDVRIIAATNRDPEALVAEGLFRRDLYYRLNVAHIHLPPLRERKEDIPQLVDMAITRLNRRLTRDIHAFSNEALAALVQYNWPGNVRELNNLIEACFLQCETKRIEFVDLPPAFTKRLHFGDGDDERSRLMAALQSTRWNKSEAARRLQWSRMRIYRSMKRYNISPTPV
ncbi:sigma-54 interaction domain-containing protein [Desulfatitalea alkaliphila]|uniref:Sigma 54-interacting transcriptional regulator n=1 Tax=Desulfatitalea alkaliphila TaxID=2929485 RepID=A0AA41UJX5_9BACT|nr:sigma 54-interacting transcriptional regulator [Desulfatitalea alkaliphila]MCJ8501689.1 sigma 54-interacting transcriptional regulator [Desulfatitalea alkaliphila]